jgi:3-hydroxybutyrate dehydrogenase/3-oxoacyl-[acyl-carrier protein] reductase
MSAGGAPDDELDESTELAETPVAPAALPLAGRVAVITGSTRGIGRGIAEGLLAAGASVMLSGRSEEKGKNAVAEIGLGDRVSFIPCDVRSQSQVEALVDGTRERYGRVDILVNNAGGTKGWALIHELSDDAWQDALNWNLNAAFWATRRALRYMLENKWGRIINISSVEGKQANKAAVSHYITNKHALNGLTKATAFEYGPQGITCNAICPGAIETDIMKVAGPGAAEAAGITYEQFLQNYADESAIKRLNTVEEVAAMAVLLASPVGGGITGALINVDGGTAQW